MVLFNNYTKQTMIFTEQNRQYIQTKGVVIGRILIGLLFLSSGLGMFFMQTPAGVAEYFTSINLPLPALLAWAVIILKVVTGTLVVLGKHVGKAAAALIVFTAGTILVAHRDPNDINLFKNLAIIGGLLYVMAFGAGRWNN